MIEFVIKYAHSYLEAIKTFKSSLAIEKIYFNGLQNSKNKTINC